MAVVIVETFNGTSQERKLVNTKDMDIRLHIDKYGRIKVLTPDKFCKTCGGCGGVRYYYYQDESTACDCPTCNGGDPAVWEQEKKDWAKFSK